MKKEILELGFLSLSPVAIWGCFVMDSVVVKSDMTGN